MISFNSTTNEAMRKDISRKIKKCVEDSIKTRFDPIPGASLVFAKPLVSDIDGYKKTIKELGE